MKMMGMLALLAGLLLFFQNCGETRGVDLLAVGEETIDSSSECNQDGTCLQSQDLLWLTIREYSPYKMEYSALNAGHFNVGGVCGIGTYLNHSFLWELREGFGNQEIVGQGFSDDLCLNGRFSVPIVPNMLPVLPDQLYILEMELVGIEENGAQVSNPMPTNRGTLDVIFTSSQE